jgi:hypothetical protein
MALTQKQATLLRDIINDWVERTAEEDQIAVIQQALGLESIAGETLYTEDENGEHGGDADWEEAVTTWQNAYEALCGMAQ